MVRPISMRPTQNDRRQRAPRWAAQATQALGDAAAQIRVISANTPANLREELDRLASCWGTAAEAPRFCYQPPADLSALRRALLEIGDELGRLGELGALYAGKARELEREAALCEEAGRPGLWAAARRRFAPRDGFDHQADAAADAWLDERPEDGADAGTVQSDDDRDPASLVSRIRQELGRRRLPLRVLVSRNLASLAATGDGCVQVVAGRALSRRDVERTVLHEIEGHVMPRFASSKARLGLFAVGTERGSDDQEGRALAMERASGFLDHARRREIALRHVAARSVEAGADFVTTTRLLLGRGTPLADALRIAARVHRGGGLGREAVYLPALLRVEHAVARDPEIDGVLGAGRVSVDAAPALREWLG